MARPVGSKSKNAILKAVETLIATQGVNAISLHDIALAAHLSQGTVYYHYETKDDIIFDIIVKHIDALKQEYIEWLARHETDLTSDRFFEVLFYKGVKLFNRAKMHIFLINECMSDNPQLKTKFIEKYREWQAALLVGVKRVFSSHPDPEAIAHITLLLLDGMIVQEVLGTSPFDQKRLLDVMKHLGGNL